MDVFTTAYLEAALWSSNDDDDRSLDTDYAVSDIHPETLAKIVQDCAKFQADHDDLINDDNVAVQSEHSCDARAGHDFWLTRNGHGAGFWDGDWTEPAATELTSASKMFGEVNLYVDNGKIYALVRRETI